MAEIRRNIKDSVFTYLFSQPEYTEQLYRALHPEDTCVTAADLKLITIENVLSNGRYNDLGIQIKNKLIILMEAQSSFCPNIPLRMLLYLEKTYNDYVLEKKINLYGKRQVNIPKPELYMVYTGNDRGVPDILSLTDLFEDDGPSDVEVKVHVLQKAGKADILEQYISFCKIEMEQVRLYGQTQRAIEEIIRICIEQDILVPFFKSREKEVRDVMSVLFDQNYIWETAKLDIQKEYHEKGREEGREEGRELERKSSILKMAKMLSPVDIANCLQLPLEYVQLVLENA